MANESENSRRHLEEGSWIDIIRRMELLHADLAWARRDAERKNEDLLRAKAFTDNIIRSMVNALVVTNRDSVITIVNDACCRLLGYAEEELLGEPIGTIFVDGGANLLPGGCELVDHGPTGGSVTDIETALRTKGGEEIPVSLSASVMRDQVGDTIGKVLVGTDLRETKRLLSEARAAAAAAREQAAERAKAYRELKAIQARLIHSEKMSSLGRMATNVAHEINNPLGAIVAYSHLVLESTSEDFIGRGNVEKILLAAGRCRDIAGDLLGFARPGPGARQTADLNALVRAAHELLNGQALLKDIEVCLDLSPTPLAIGCDSGQLQQAFTGILVNAAEAIDGWGAVTIRSWRDADRGMAAVSFTDTGCGIPSENLGRIFEPFFTTKQAAHGTGLGLAIIYGIIENHAGTIKVDSHRGEGTTLTVCLPAGSGQEGVV